MAQNSRKNVVFLAGASPSVAAFRGPLIRTLKDAGVTQKWILAEPHEASEKMLAEIGIPYGFMGLDRGSLNPIKDFAAIRKVWLMLRTAQDQVFVVYSLKLILYVGFMALLLRPFGLRKRVVLSGFVPGLGYSMNSGPNAGFKRKLLTQVVRFACRFAFASYDHIVFTNSDNRKVVEELKLGNYSRSSIVPGAGVDPQKFPATKPKAVQDKIRFVSVGRLLKDKGAVELIAATKKLQKTHPDQFELLFYGNIDSSNLTGISEAVIDEIKDYDFLRLKGRTDNVPAAFQNSHVGVLPSHHEGRPTVVMEWMATGRAGITTLAPGCRETITDGHDGFLVPVGDADALHKAMSKYLDNPELISKFGKEAAQTAKEKFDIAIVVPQTIAGLGIKVE